MKAESATDCFDLLGSTVGGIRPFIHMNTPISAWSAKVAWHDMNVDVWDVVTYHKCVNVLRSLAHF